LKQINKIASSRRKRSRKRGRERQAEKTIAM
jgi:hypothetical protein